MEIAIVFLGAALFQNSCGSDGRQAVDPSKASDRLLIVEERSVVVRGVWEHEGRKIEGEWHVAADPQAAGVVVRQRIGDVPRNFELLAEPGVGRTVQITARLTHARSFWMLVLGVATLSPTGEDIEYRMFILQGWGDTGAKEWIWTDPLITRPAKKAFDGMSILFPGGDSVAFGLHDLGRGGDEGDEIESHFFVNHCPGGDKEYKLFTTGTEHYVSRVVGGESLTKFRSTPEDPK